MGKIKQITKSKFATAPYNFVSLNKEKVIEGQEMPQNDKYEIKRNTGSINLKITCLTPIFIRGREEESFKINDQYIIPGSSIRGMTRTLIEILSWSKFEFINKEKYLYYRNIGDKFYKNQFLESNPNVINLVKSGWLKFESNRYTLYPSVKTKFLDGEVQYFKVHGHYTNKNSEFVINTMDGGILKTSVNAEFKKIHFNPDKISKYHIKNIANNNITIYLEYNEINEISIFQYDHFQEGFLVTSGFVEGKHFNWVINAPDSSPLNIPDVAMRSIIEKYDGDIERDKTIDILARSIEFSRNNGIGFPCFYLEDLDGNVEMIGHTGMFRLKHKYNVENLLPNVHKDKGSDKLDFATTIFGNTKYASRVFFEDCKSINVEILPEEVLQNLASPSISYFPNYLHQPKSYNTPREQLHHWSDLNAELRGYKLYWHKQNGVEFINNEISISRKNLDKFLVLHSMTYELFCANYKNYFNKKDEKYIFNKKFTSLPMEIQEFIHNLIYKFKDEVSGENEKQQQFTSAKVINSNSEFAGKIRFENLTNEELGALLFALDLPENLHHKIGMGKPLGLGSIKIEVNLDIYDLALKYKSLFSLNEDRSTMSMNSCTDFDKFKAAFAAHILKELKVTITENCIGALWNQERLKELAIMLEFNKDNDLNWKNITDYMKLEVQNLVQNKKERPFADRRILPKPAEVIKLSK